MNMSSPLSINGKNIAKELSFHHEFRNLDMIVASCYKRAKDTAKFFAKRNNLEIMINSKFNERRHGVNNWNELPNDFEKRQWDDMNYKMDDGDSLNEVRNNMLEGFKELINNDKEKILVVGHATAITTLLSSFGEFKYGEYLKYKDKVILSERWKYLECFKIEIDDNEVVNITNLKNI